MNISRIATQAATAAVLGAALVTGLAVQPADFSRMYGTCPAPSTDPLSACYDQFAANAARAAAAVTAQRAEGALTAGRVCWAPGGKEIPALVIMRDPSGTVVGETFDKAWTDAGHGWTVLRFCR